MKKEIVVFPPVPHINGGSGVGSRDANRGGEQSLLYLFYWFWLRYHSVKPKAIVPKSPDEEVQETFRIAYRLLKGIN